MGKIEVILDAEKFEMDESNRSESLEKISKALAPGVPVMVKRFGMDSIRGLQKRNYSRLFFSDGRLIPKDASFGVEKGRNYFYIAFEEKPEYYKININHDASIDKLVLPFMEFVPMFCENTFSPSGPSVERRLRSGGTSKVIIGEQVVREYPEQVEALKFAKDSFYVNIPKSYSMPGYSLNAKDDEKLEEIIKIVNEAASVNAIITLLKHGLEDHDLKSIMYAVKISDLAFVGNSKLDDFKKESSANDSDYAVTLLNASAHNAIAVVKLSRGTFYGDVFVRPLRENYAERIEKALAPEIVSAYFPKH